MDSRIAQVQEVLRVYPGLQLRPFIDDLITMSGELAFAAQKPGYERIEDSFQIQLSVGEQFPKELPAVRELGGRIPREYHMIDNGELCLGSPTRLMLALTKEPTILAFIRTCVIPYLYGFAYWERHGEMPYGELAHGRKGVLRDMASLFHVDSEQAALQMIELAALKQGVANKHPCPCGSGLVLAKCHNRVVNHLRRSLGSAWFRDQHRWLGRPSARYHRVIE